MEIVQETGEEVGKLCKDFTTYYIGMVAVSHSVGPIRIFVLFFQARW